MLPRQNGKGEILLARELAGLFLFGEELILHSAHEFRTAQDAYRRLVEVIERTPHLDSLVKRKLNNTTETSIELVSGQRCRFVSRTKGAGRGLTGDVVILDEAYKLPAEAMAALVPTMAARPNRQLWYTSSAPLPTPESDTLRRLCLRGRAGLGDRLAYSEYCVLASSHHDVDLTDHDLWRQANPGMLSYSDHAIEVEAVETEYESMAAEDFARERLGVVNLEATSGRVISADMWAACADPKSGPGEQVSFSLDVSPNRDTVAFAVAGESGRGGVHVEVISHGPHPGTDWLVGEAKRLQDTHGGQLALVAGSPAGSLIEAMEAGGVRTHLMPAAEYVQACGDFYDAVTQTDVLHLDQTELTTAVAGADRKWSADAWYWARRTSTEDITPLVAVTTARWAHLHAPVAAALSVW